VGTPHRCWRGAFPTVLVSAAYTAFPLIVRVRLPQDAFTVRQRLLKEAQAVDATKSFIHLMVHADTQGSVDAIQDILHRLPPEDLNIKIVRTSVGDISPTDVDMAVMSKSIVIAFNVKVTTSLAKILSSMVALAASVSLTCVNK
jgi:translation initiation factor IF-2